MIINNNSKRLIISLSIILILPFVQNQWLNLYSFNNNTYFYSFLYYLSGSICPSLICFNSLNYFTYYKFYKNKTISKNKIKGKLLLGLVTLILLFISYLIAEYLYINIDLINNLFFEGINIKQPDIYKFSFFIIMIAIFLIFRKSRLLLKKLILLNFILISFFIWFMQINNIDIDGQFYIYKYYLQDNVNLINIGFLFSIEINYFIWSIISDKNNLSDWMVPLPDKRDIFPALKIIIFYFFIVIYYSILT